MMQKRKMLHNKDIRPKYINTIHNDTLYSNMPIPLIYVKTCANFDKVYSKIMDTSKIKCNKRALIHAMNVGKDRVVCQKFSFNSFDGERMSLCLLVMFR